MEIKKEDFVRFRIVDTFFYALPASFFNGNITVEDIIEEEVKEVEIKVVIEPTEEELEAIAKAKEIEDLKAKLASLEE